MSETATQNLTIRDIITMDADERASLSDDDILDALPESLADIGGGDGYDPDADSPTGSGRVTADDADRVASDIGELASEAEALEAGETLWVEPGKYEYGNDLAESFRIDVPDAEIASDRGVNGSEGAMFRHTGTYGGSHGLHLAADGCRVTGVRVHRNEIGTWATREEYEAADTDLSFEEFKLDEKLKERGADEETRKELLKRGKAVYGVGATDGILIEAKNCEIDNTEIRGCVHAAVTVKRGEGSYQIDNNTRIHHNQLTDNAGPSLGYGVTVRSGHPIIERNFINRCRHHIAGDGGRDCGYDHRENLHGPESTAHAIDMHEDKRDSNGIMRGGHACDVVRNVVLTDATGVKWRATPWDSHEVTVEGNFFVNESQSGGAGAQGDGVFQMHRRGSVGFQQMKLKNNSHGKGTPNAKTGPPGVFDEAAAGPAPGSGGDEGGDEDGGEAPPPKDRPEVPDRDPDTRDIFAILDLIRWVVERTRGK